MAGPLANNSKDLNFDVRRFGDPANPCVISIVSTGASMNGMNPIVEGLAERGLYVINFNPRDSCGTTAFKQCQDLVPKDQNLMEVLGAIFKEDGSVDPSAEFAAPFNWHDMADDVAAIMDKEKIEKASIIGFSTGGSLGQVMMCRLKDRLHCAVLCSSGYEKMPSQSNPVESDIVKELMAKAATVTPESAKEDRVAAILPGLMAMWEVSEGDPWEAVLRKGIEDDCDNGWMDSFGGMNPYSILAWASFTKFHDQHLEELRSNKVPCLVVVGKKDPIVPHQQSEMLAANTGAAELMTHDYGHLLGPKENSAQMLDKIAAFIKEQ